MTAAAPPAAPWRSRIVGEGSADPRALIANPRNWRLHPKAQQRAVAAVLDRVGWVEQVLVNRNTGHLVDVHLRVELAIERGEPVVPVSYVELSDEEEALVLASLDPLAGMALTDADRLSELMADLSIDQSDLEEHLAALLAGKRKVGLADPDEVPEPPDTATTRPGDLWQLGEHRLLCGDAGSAVDLDRLLEGRPADLLVTDPPYNVRVEPRSNNAIAAGLSSFSASVSHHQALDLARHPEKAQPTSRKLRAKDRPLANDFLAAEEFAARLASWFGNAARVLRPGGGFYIWGGYANLANYPAPLAAAGLYFSQAIVWDKEHPVLTRKDFMGAHELAFYGWREGAAHRFFGPPNVPDLWHVKKVNPASMVHLTEKPVELSRLAIEYSSLPGETVLDTFAGSGSTLIAAEETGRRAYLVELDPLYCDVIVERWRRFSGEPAERVEPSDRRG